MKKNNPTILLVDDDPDEPAFIPTVVFSGSADNDDIKKAYGLGAAFDRVKPSEPSMLFTLVKALHAYWVLCELPEREGVRSRPGTASGFKLGGRFSNRPDPRDV